MGFSLESIGMKEGGRYESIFRMKKWMPLQ